MISFFSPKIINHMGGLEEGAYEVYSYVEKIIKQVLSCIEDYVDDGKAAYKCSNFLEHIDSVFMSEHLIMPELYI